MERWKTIPGHPDYEASDLGRLRSYKKNNRYSGRVMNTSIDKNGYRWVTLETNCKHYYRTVSRLVLMAFVGLPMPGMQAAHGDGNPLNNYLSNLRWATRKENNDDKYIHGTILRGSKIGNSKLTEEDARNVVAFYCLGCEINDLAERYALAPLNIKKILDGRFWSHATGIKYAAAGA